MNIESILNCEDKPLLNKIEGAIAVFDGLDLSKTYCLSFSGGKDSHALLIVFLLWQKIREINTDNFTVVFADTKLETPELYFLIHKIEETVKTVKLKRVYGVNSYWWYQFIYGLPVPNWKNRWCTSRLKTDAIEQMGQISITGRHLGESKARDLRLKCTSGECGTDKIKQSIDPILNFNNCDVWDLIYYADNTILYHGVFNALKNTYDQSTDDKGSLRMGCFMCPVVGLGTIKNNKFREGILIREFLEKLRNCQRINNPRTKKAGAIYIIDRRLYWEKLDRQLLLDLNYITQSDLNTINLALRSDYAYPKTYSKEWIDSEHDRLAKKTIYTGLPLFEFMEI